MSEELTRKRARELRMLCSPWAFQDSRCKDFKPETKQERERVIEISERIRGFSYYSTLCEIEHGRAGG